MWPMALYSNVLLCNCSSQNAFKENIFNDNFFCLSNFQIFLYMKSSKRMPLIAQYFLALHLWKMFMGCVIAHSTSLPIICIFQFICTFHHIQLQKDPCTLHILHIVFISQRIEFHFSFKYINIDKYLNQSFPFAILLTIVQMQLCELQLNEKFDWLHSKSRRCWRIFMYEILQFTTDCGDHFFIQSKLMKTRFQNYVEFEWNRKIHFKFWIGNHVAYHWMSFMEKS